jgi:hypothetical protein
MKKKKAVPLSALRAYFELDEFGDGLVTRIIDRVGLSNSNAADTLEPSSKDKDKKTTNSARFELVAPTRPANFVIVADPFQSFPSPKEVEAKRQAEELEKLLSGMADKDKDTLKSGDQTQSMPPRTTQKRRRKK